MTEGVIPRILKALNEEMLVELDLAKSIQHPGESGRAREQMLQRFIARIVPQVYSVSTGFVIDANGGVSRQIDLLIHRNDYHPVFDIGGIKHFMVESVVAVIENKARIRSGAVLRNALENIESVKNLDRTNNGKNYIVRADLHGDFISADDHKAQVFGAVVAQESLSPKKLVSEIQSFLAAHDRPVWPNMYIDVRRFIGQYGVKEESSVQPTVRTSDATHFILSDDNVSLLEQPLIHLAAELINFLRVAYLVDFHPADYIPSLGGTFHVMEIPDSDAVA